MNNLVFGQNSGERKNALKIFGFLSPPYPLSLLPKPSLLSLHRRPPSSGNFTDRRGCQSEAQTISFPPRTTSTGEWRQKRLVQSRENERTVTFGASSGHLAAAPTFLQLTPTSLSFKTPRSGPDVTFIHGRHTGILTLT